MKLIMNFFLNNNAYDSHCLQKKVSFNFKKLENHKSLTVVSAFLGLKMVLHPLYISLHHLTEDENRFLEFVHSL